MKDLLLLHINGTALPGICSEVSALLGRFDADVLDINQSSLHSALSLSFLLGLPKGAPTEALYKELMLSLDEWDLQAQLHTVSEGEYQRWVELHAAPRQIVHLLAPTVSAEQIAKVAAIAEAHGLIVEHISRLSERVALAAINHQQSSCVEFLLRGEVRDGNELRRDFLALGMALDADIAVQQDNAWRRHRRLVCFDMDSTLIKAEVIDELAYRAGVGEQVAEITAAAMRGELDFNESFARRMGLLEGLSEEVLEDVAANLPMMDGVEKLFAGLNKLGYKTAILSGGFNYFGRYLQKKLGVDYVYANELEIENGKVTGRVAGTVVNGERKAALLKELAEKEGLSLEQTIAVGDGANDLPMLSTAGLGVAFHAKPLVKQKARNSISTLGLDALLYLLGVGAGDLH